jgi:DNA repair exonuclease SbcCD ATPase subunit
MDPSIEEYIILLTKQVNEYTNQLTIHRGKLKLLHERNDLNMELISVNQNIIKTDLEIREIQEKIRKLQEHENQVQERYKELQNQHNDISSRYQQKCNECNLVKETQKDIEKIIVKINDKLDNKSFELNKIREAMSTLQIYRYKFKKINEKKAYYVRCLNYIRTNKKEKHGNVDTLDDRGFPDELHDDETYKEIYKRCVLMAHQHYNRVLLIKGGPYEGCRNCSCDYCQTYEKCTWDGISLTCQCGTCKYYWSVTDKELMDGYFNLDSKKPVGSQEIY